jgi:hypothetical protein
MCRARCQPGHGHGHAQAADIQGRREDATRTFSTDTPGWLPKGVTRAGMEFTGVFWKPCYYLLEDRIPEMGLLNAAHMKNVAGRITERRRFGVDRPAGLTRPHAALVRAAADPGAAGFHPVPQDLGGGTHAGHPPAGEDSAGRRHQALQRRLDGPDEVWAGDPGGDARWAK